MLNESWLWPTKAAKLNPLELVRLVLDSANERQFMQKRERLDIVETMFRNIFTYGRVNRFIGRGRHEIQYLIFPLQEIACQEIPRVFLN
jgi:hypothetical protein